MLNKESVATTTGVLIPNVTLSSTELGKQLPGIKDGKIPEVFSQEEKEAFFAPALKAMKLIGDSIGVTIPDDTFNRLFVVDFNTLQTMADSIYSQKDIATRGLQGITFPNRLAVILREDIPTYSFIKDPLSRQRLIEEEKIRRDEYSIWSGIHEMWHSLSVHESWIPIGQEQNWGNYLKNDHRKRSGISMGGRKPTVSGASFNTIDEGFTEYLTRWTLDELWGDYDTEYAGYNGEVELIEQLIDDIGIEPLLAAMFKTDGIKVLVTALNKTYGSQALKKILDKIYEDKLEYDAEKHDIMDDDYLDFSKTITFLRTSKTSQD